ncbi:calpain-B-like [Anopheles aquasalis]|uniref:calpain-B-like n=1 Tax=Anopheles aquasalis TaxID=42839 RepID=UPI00215A4DF4|nr:calpain-B-like [Anopheles aquasalis]
MQSVKCLSEASDVKSKCESNSDVASCKAEVGVKKNAADQVSCTLHGQEFSAIRAHCLANGTLFEDPTFSASDFSIYTSPPPNRGKSGIKWKRPQEIVDDPQFFTDGYSRFDIRQGELGNCWFLSSCASLASKPHLFERVVPTDNGNFSDKDQYAGVFHFRFWHYGRWVEVVVDDRLPVTRGEELLYGRSSVENEFWSALLEKAYAKLHGCYHALAGGTGWEGTVDLTGGLAETHTLKGWQPIDLFERLEKCTVRDTLVTAGILKVETDDLLRLVNLVKGHEYSITRVERLHSHKHMIGMEDQEPREIRLICLRNPWGYDEWNRAWSDESSEWERVTSKKRKQLCSVKEDGEFWMHYDEFVTYFDDLTICHQCPSSVLQGQMACEPNEMITLHGQWVRGVSAGGSDSASFCRNPQYLIQLGKGNEQSETESNEIDAIVDSPIGVTIGLRPKHNHRQSVDEIPIRFLVFPVGPEVSDCTRSLPKSFFDSATAVDGCPELKSERELVKRLLLPAGRYVIVPHTWKPQLNGEFIMRIFSEGSLKVESLEQSLGCTTNAVEKYIPTNNFDNAVLPVTIQELQKMIQSAFDGLTIDEETLRTLVYWYGNQSNEGCLRSDETEVLLQNMTSWELIFRQHCNAPDGKLCTFDLRNALFAGGVLVDTRALSTIVHVHQYLPMDLATFVVCAMETREIIEWCTMRGLAQPTTAMYFKELYGRRKLLDMCLKSQLTVDMKNARP